MPSFFAHGWIRTLLGKQRPMTWRRLSGTIIPSSRRRQRSADQPRTKISDVNFTRGMNSRVQYPHTPRDWHDGSFDYEER